MPEWITVKEAAELLNISRRQVVNRIHKGQLKARKEGKLWLIDRSLSPDVEESEELPETSPTVAFGKFEELEEMVNYLKTQIEKKDQELGAKNEQIANLQNAAQQQNAIIMQLSRQLEQSQRLLEYHQLPWWRRWFRKGRTEQ